MNGWQLVCDTEENGTFAEDITRHILEARWRLGMGSPAANVAEGGVAQLTVFEQAFPWQTLIGKPFKIQFDGKDGILVLFTGTIHRLEKVGTRRRTATLTLYAYDALHTLLPWRVTLPARAEQTADEAIHAILARVPLKRNELALRWRLGKSQLNHTTRFHAPLPRALQTGKTRFLLASLDQETPQTAQTLLEAFVNAEGGCFFYSRNGEAVFYNRHTRLTAHDPVFTVENSAEDAKLTLSVPLSRVQVRYTPRRIGHANSVLWQLESTLTIAPHSTHTIRLQWWDGANNRPMQAFDITPPAFPQDYTLNTHPQGNGKTVLTHATLALYEASTTGAQLVIRNANAYPIYLLAGAQIRGTPLLTDSPMTLEAHSLSVTADFGGQERLLWLPLLNDSTHANALARLTLGHAISSGWHIEQLTLSSHRHGETLLNPTLYNVIRVQLDDFPHPQDYEIVSEEHALTKAGTNHRVTWGLAPRPPHFWQLNRAKLVQNTHLAY